MSKKTYKLKNIILLSLFGEIFEGHDFMIFGLLASPLAIVFFPTGDHVASLLFLFGTFAAGFITRPFGGMIFGYIGDRWGRKQAFISTLIIMGISTLLIGLLPPYSVAGNLAPVFLIILRLAQGVSFGGEYTGSMVFLGEHANDKIRGFFSSFAGVGPLIGTLIGAIFVALINHLKPSQIIDWGWRIPFIIGGIAILFGGKYRNNLEETPVFSLQAKNNDFSYITAFKSILKYKALPLRIMGLSAAICALSFLSIIYMPTYLTTFIHFPATLALSINIASIIALIFLIPVFGYLSDKYGRKTIMLYASSGLTIFAYPAYLLIASKNPLMLICGQIILIVFNAALTGVLPSMLIELVATMRRCAFVSTFYNIASSIFGGTAPLVVTYLISSYKNNLMPAFYISCFAIISGGFALKLKKRQLTPLNEITES